MSDEDTIAELNMIVLYFLAILYTVTFFFCSVRVGPYLIVACKKKNNCESISSNADLITKFRQDQACMSFDETNFLKLDSKFTDRRSSSAQVIRKMSSSNSDQSIDHPDGGVVNGSNQDKKVLGFISAPRNPFGN